MIEINDFYIYVWPVPLKIHPLKSHKGGGWSQVCRNYEACQIKQKTDKPRDIISQ